MKTYSKLIIGILYTLSCSMAMAELDVPGDGSDGVFAPSANIQIDLSQAVSASWDNNNAANAGKGVYDPSKWAVVFKYSSVNIPAGVTVTFKNHPTRAPVVWLVTGDVMISGTIRLDSKAGSSLVPSEPGPGGFRGGMGPGNSSDPRGPGFGPGGGNPGVAGAYATTSGAAGTYGNSKILPLIGGSGSGAATAFNGTQDGMAGGGAILIACRNRVTLNGMISCRSANNTEVTAVAGSGGALRIVADNVTGTGIADVRPGPFGTYGAAGGQGRIRLEASTYTASIVFQPTTILVSPDNPVQIWPEANAPSCRVVSIDGHPVPADPQSMLDAPGADVIFPGGGAVPIVVETSNMPTDSVVSVRIAPVRGNAITVNAAFQSGNQSQATWTVSATVPSGHSAVQVRAVAP